MKILKLSVFVSYILTSVLFAADTAPFPVPQTVSPEQQQLIGAPHSYWKTTRPRTQEEWHTLVDGMAAQAAMAVPALMEKMNVSVTQDSMAGVPVYIITPNDWQDDGRVLLHLHGGGYVINPGEAGIGEGILMAGFGKFRVISVDYRMAPDHPYPAAIDDAVAVYRELLKTVPAAKIGVFGTSTGGGMTLVLVLRALADGLAVPGAIAPGTPWTDLSKTGDSYFVLDGVDNVLVTYDGLLGEAARVYAGTNDLKDPYLSPVYAADADLAKFPPSLFTSGTRDLFLSNTARMHLRLRQAGTDADLIVFEGLSHAQYMMALDAPETKLHFDLLADFFRTKLK